MVGVAHTGILFCTFSLCFSSISFLKLQFCPWRGYLDIDMEILDLIKNNHLGIALDDSVWTPNSDYILANY